MLNNDVEINMLDSNLLITSSEKESAQMERATNRDRQLLGEDSWGIGLRGRDRYMGQSAPWDIV